MNTRARLLSVLLSGLLPAAALASIPSDATPSVIVSTAREPVAAGPFAPTWDSLRGYEAPEWFRDAKFGMFIHWGVYSLLGKGEWVMENDRMTVADYEKLPPRFDPADYEPAEWVRIAKDAGMRYITITSKHHDGFAMWDSKVSDYDIVDRTPFLITHGERDFPHLIAQADEMARALQSAGVAVQRLTLPGLDHFTASYHCGETRGMWLDRAASFIEQHSRSSSRERFQ